jgi:hypothetical protein
MILSLDELIEREYERETREGDDMTVGTCTQAYAAAVLEEPPSEGRRGPRDLVDLMGG